MRVSNKFDQDNSLHLEIELWFPIIIHQQISNWSEKSYWKHTTQYKALFPLDVLIIEVKF